MATEVEIMSTSTPIRFSGIVSLRLVAVVHDFILALIIMHDTCCARGVLF